MSAGPEVHLLWEPFRSLQAAEIAVKGAEGEMSSFTGDFQDQTVRETELGLLSVLFKGGVYGFSILDCETFVLQEHFDRHNKLAMAKTVNRREDPNSLDQSKVRNPCTSRNKRLSSQDVFWIIAGDESDQEVGINRAHTGL